LLRLGRFHVLGHLPVHSDVKAVRLSREELARLGYKPGDGRGGVIPVAPAQHSSEGHGKGHIEVNAPRRSHTPEPQPCDTSANRGHDVAWQSGSSRHGPPRNTPAIRVPARRLNGVEKRWLAVLRLRYLNCEITPQFRVRVSAFDAPTVTHYTADFAVWRPSGDDAWKCILWECKDARRRPHSDELTRPKMARQNNPWISQIWLATWDGVTWEERILA
jgi:hypothetical protein